MSITNSLTTPKPPIDRFIWAYRLIFICVLPVTIWMASKPVPKVEIPVFKYNISTYHVITQRDLYLKWIDKNNVTSNNVLYTYDLVGHYTLVPIFSNQPILENQIGHIPDPNLILKTVEVAIPANMITTLGSSLLAGDIVSMAVVSLSNITSPPRIVFDRVLILDIKVTGSQTVIILAIPANRLLDYLTETHNATVVLSKMLD